MVKSEEVRVVFDVAKHLPMVWKQVKALGLNSEQLQTDWKYYLEYFAPKTQTPSENFLKWGVDVLQIVMNMKLKREMSHPTFFRMMHYLLETEIESNERIRQIRHAEKS
jgi:hypothetical protein